MRLAAVVRAVARQPVAVAIGLLFSTTAAVGAPTPNQMPGGGRILAFSPGSRGSTQGGVGIGLTNLVSGGGFGFDGKMVIRWGGATAPADATNPLGSTSGPTPRCNVDILNTGNIFANRFAAYFRHHRERGLHIRDRDWRGWCPLPVERQHAVGRDGQQRRTGGNLCRYRAGHRCLFRHRLGVPLQRGIGPPVRKPLRASTQVAAHPGHDLRRLDELGVGGEHVGA